MSKCKKEQVPYDPTADEISAAPRAFQYELNMFRRCVQMLDFFERPCAIMLDTCVRNSLLEAALLHARNLLEFFSGSQPMKGSNYEDSIRAGHFVRESCGDQESAWKHFHLPHTQSRKKDMNKSLSHLTFARLQRDYEWHDLPKIKMEIEAAYAEFFQLLPERDQGRWPAPEG